MGKWKISEDWTSTGVGWLIILLVVFQLKPHWPSFSWADSEALMNKVFTLDNVGHALIVFCFMFVMALVAGFFTGKRLKTVVMRSSWSTASRRAARTSLSASFSLCWLRPT